MQLSWLLCRGREPGRVVQAPSPPVPALGQLQCLATPRDTPSVRGTRRVWVLHPRCVAAHPESMGSPASPRLTLRPSPPSVPFPLLTTSDTPPPGSPPGSPPGPCRALLRPLLPLPTRTSRSREMTRSVAESQLCAQRRPQHVWGLRSREGHLGRGGSGPAKRCSRKKCPETAVPQAGPLAPPVTTEMSCGR